MSTEQIIHTSKTVLTGVFFIAVIWNVIRFLLMEYRLYKRDRVAIETDRATVYYKHPEMEPVLAGRSSTYVYHITFHTESGESLKLYMNPTEYYKIQEGDTGKLTWQGPRFWKFEQEE